MKGRPRLVDLKEVVQGTPVFWTKSLKFPWEVVTFSHDYRLVIELKGEVSSATMVDAKELRAVVIEYQKGGLDQHTAGELRYLPVKTDQWKYAIEHLCEDVEFYGEQQTRTGEVFAKIVPKEELPTPVWPEEEITLKQLVEQRKQDVVDYMNKYFTKKEAKRHADNINTLLMCEDDLASLEQQKLAKR